MQKAYLAKLKNRQLPVVIEKDEAGLYTVECPLLRGCYSQGSTIDEALKNIREVILLALEEKENQSVVRQYEPTEVSLHTISL